MKTSTYPRLANGQPAISCFALSEAELLRRLDSAHGRADRLAAQEVPTGDATALMQALIYAGRGQLWHANFPDGLRLLVCDNQLFRLTADLPGQLLAANDGRALDFFDYGYVADVLREWLLSPAVLPSEAHCLRRALAWAEERGSGLRDFSQERDA
jgi:hypothetical protein